MPERKKEDSIKSILDFLEAAKKMPAQKEEEEEEEDDDEELRSLLEQFQ